LEPEEGAVCRGGRLFTRRPFVDEIVPFVGVEVVRRRGDCGVDAEVKARFWAGVESEAHCSTQADCFRIRKRCRPNSEH
jgi:hypothetical protein